jgi:hypothetical protein
VDLDGSQERQPRWFSTRWPLFGLTTPLNGEALPPLGVAVTATPMTPESVQRLIHSASGARKPF